MPLAPELAAVELERAAEVCAHVDRGDELLAFAEVPPRVDYTLTEQGHALLEGVMAFDAYLRRFR